MRYCPVAVTPHVRTKVMVLCGGKAGKVTPPVSRFGHWPSTGHTAAMRATLAVQEVTLQLGPTPGLSATVALLAAVLPVLVKVTV